MDFRYTVMNDWRLPTYRVVLLSGLLSTLLSLSGALFAAASSEQVLDGVINLYPRAQLVETSQGRVTTHRVMLGPLKKIDGEITPDASLYVQGLRSRHTYLIPDEQRTGLVFDFFAAQLQKKGQILYQCAAMECGRSNYWANSVFDRRILFGPDQYQHYVIGIINGYYTAIYVAQRATGQVYAHLDVIEDQQASLLDGDNLLRALQTLLGVQLMTEPNEEITKKLVQVLTSDAAINLYIVAHDALRAAETVPAAIERSTQVATAFKARLLAAGIGAERLQAYGVGPLAPLEGAAQNRLELILIR